MSNITISGDNNTTSLVIASSNSSINAGDTIEDYIQDYIEAIQDYIRTTLSDSLTNQFLTSNNLTIRDKTAILDNIELCWVGEPETFYQDVKDLNIQNNGLKIFSHFTEIVKQHSINLQTTDGSFVSIQFSLTPDIFSKIQYVNSKVPENLKVTQQGYHTLGLINNTISFPITDSATGVISSKSVKQILNSESERFGIFQYYNLYSYDETFEYVIVTYNPYDVKYNGVYKFNLDGTGPYYNNINTNYRYYFYQLRVNYLSINSSTWLFYDELNDINTFNYINNGNLDVLRVLDNNNQQAKVAYSNNPFPPVLILGETNLGSELSYENYYYDDYNLYSYIDTTLGYVNLNYYAVQSYNKIKNKTTIALTPMSINSIQPSVGTWYWKMTFFNGNNDIYTYANIPNDNNASFYLNNLVAFTNNQNSWPKTTNYGSNSYQFTNSMEYIDITKSKTQYLQVALTPIIMANPNILNTKKQYILNSLSYLFYLLFNPASQISLRGITDLILIDIAVNLLYNVVTDINITTQANIDLNLYNILSSKTTISILSRVYNPTGLDDWYNISLNKSHFNKTLRNIS